MKSCKELLQLTRATATIQDNIDMISNPQCWSGFVLALWKVPDGIPGVIIPEDLYSGEVTVKLANKFLLPNSLELYKELPEERFSTIQEMVDAGWRVD